MQSHASKKESAQSVTGRFTLTMAVGVRCKALARQCEKGLKN